MIKVLIITHDVIGERMAGPAIRCCELGRQLAQTCDVTVATFMPLSEPVDLGIRVVSFEDDHERLRALGSAADVLVLQGLMLRRYPLLLELGKRIVMDLYDPFIFESYPHFLEQNDGGKEAFLHFWDVMNEQMEVADFSICASERQRDMWLGRYCALGRLTPELYKEDSSFRRLVDVVPFGVSDEPIRHERQVLKGVVPGIGPDDKVLLWGGGIWNWFDPLTLIEAMGHIARVRSDVKLYFLGVKHPNPEIPEMEMATRAVELAERLGLMDRSVFFNFGWVPYGDRQNYLAEADIGVSCHFDSIETRFSFRTRVLDYLWAGLPIISTEGDSMAELVAARGLGAVARYGSVDDWVAGILRLLDDDAAWHSAHLAVRALAQEFRWSKVVGPLVRFCEQPSPLPGVAWSVSRNFRRGSVFTRTLGVARRVIRVLRVEGPSGVVGKAVRKLRRRSRISR